MIAGEYGILLRLDTCVDVSTGLTEATFVVTAPDGTTVFTRTYTGAGGITVEGDGTDGVFLYQTLNGDFPNGGPYRLLLTVDFGATKRLKRRRTLVVDPDE